MDAMATPEFTVAGLRAGDQVDAVFACSRKDRLTARSGTPYLALELRDRTGAIQARAFKDADVLAGRFERGDLVRVAGRVERFRDELQIDVRAIARAEQADPAAFLPVAYRNVDELDGFLEHLAREVHDAAYAGLLARLIDDEALRAQWRRAPCTRGGHHAYLGGLLEHTVAVGTLALECAQLHPRLNPDLLLTAALVHDLGKIARVHLRGRDRPHRRGPAARPHRARPAAARRLRAPGGPPDRALPLHPHPPRVRSRHPAGASAAPRRSRSTASTRSTPRSRARWSTGYHRQP